jgi:geranylgeranylglycerol-phosphate geranylgeranyltransferase
MKNELNKHTNINEINNKTNSLQLKPIHKIKSLFTLIRSNNIIPTTLLCFSGAWIINPSINHLLYSIPFIVSTINTIMIMSTSMILNDIYDINIDKINNPNKPLVNGNIKIYEAVILSFCLISIVEYLTLNYLEDNLKIIIQLAIIQITIYTPILKKILIIKNISCASLISFSLFFTGLSVSNSLMNINKNFGLLSIAINIIFFGSLCNELLLDIRDREGDKENNIITIPTLLGNNFSWIISNIILNFNIISNSLSIAYLYNDKLALFLPIFLFPLLINLYNIKKNNYSNESIANYMKKSNYSLILILFYLCIIARFF